MKPLKIKVHDKITLQENLFNYKKWFNGLKKFSSLHIRQLDKKPQ